ncbi:MAG: hypothetical protein JXA71_17845 [Chitinispirillaceae bacterium]|nr:hypothetical protein [Chitinispirillaceae bacterium]
MDSGRTTRIISERGFTLVEGIVVAALTVIIAAVMLTIFQMNGQAVSNGAVNTRIQMQYETVVSQIGQKTRYANAVLDGSGAGESWPPSENAAPVPHTKTVWVFGPNNTGMIGGYQITGTTLREYDLTIHDWKNFSVGSSDVKVTESSGFSLSGDRKWLTVNISVFSTLLSITDTAFSKQEVFLCRN